MGGIPLVALQGRGPQIRDAGEQALLAAQTQNLQNQNALGPGQLQAQQNELQGQQLQLQQQRQQLSDQQAMTKAMQDWDGTDYNALPGLMLKHGASATAVLGTKTALIKQQTDLNSLNESQQALEKLKNDHFAQALGDVLSAPADQQALALENAKAVSVQKGWLSPKDAQGIQYQGPQQLEAYRKMLIGRGAALDEILKNSQALEAAGKGYQAQQEGNLFSAKTPGATAESTIQQQNAAMTPQQRALAGNLFYGAAGGDAQEKKALNLETQQKIAAAQAGVAGANSALRGVPAHLVPAATADATKAGQEFADATAAARDMKTFVDLAKNGNKIAYAYSPTEGVLTLNTARGVKRVNMPEIQSYGGAGGAADRVMAFLGKQASGASIPDNVLDDMATLHQSIAANAQQTYGSKLKVINQNYGSSFQPVDMGGGSTVKMRAPNGQIKDVSPDEVEHYKSKGAKVVQ